MGVWNVIQLLGEKACEEEQNLVKTHKMGRVKGRKEALVILEESDGVYVRWQRGEQHKADITGGIAYDSWKRTGKYRYALDGKAVVAGISKSKNFQEYKK